MLARTTACPQPREQNNFRLKATHDINRNGMPCARKHISQHSLWTPTSKLSVNAAAQNATHKTSTEVAYRFSLSRHCSKLPYENSSYIRRAAAIGVQKCCPKACFSQGCGSRLGRNSIYHISLATWCNSTVWYHCPKCSCKTDILIKSTS